MTSRDTERSAHVPDNESARIAAVRRYEILDTPADGSFDRITASPGKMNGQPCIRNMRITVRRVVELVAIYPDRTELKYEFPELEDEDIKQALQYAAANLEDQSIELNATHETAA